jgi:hypothetical protein
MHSYPRPSSLLRQLVHPNSVHAEKTGGISDCIDQVGAAVHAYDRSENILGYWTNQTAA